METRVQVQKRFYKVAGITIQVESDLPITSATFAKKFAGFRVDGPGVDTVVIRHHFGLPEPVPGMNGTQRPEEVYRRPPWAIYRTGDSWLYLGIAPNADDPTLHRVAVFSADHSSGDIHNTEAQLQLWSGGGLNSLTLFPSDQILEARLLADRDGCLLHAGGLRIDSHGFVFVGHSDAGKSTIVQLVREKLGDRAEILCDDRNVVRRWPGGSWGGSPGFFVHGTWSHGDTPDVSSASAPLRAVMFLEKSDRNELVPLSNRKEILQRLLATLIKPLVTADWWHKEMSVLEQLMGEVPCFIMRFDKSGAIVAELERLLS
jgi:hypothetical protein